MGQRVMFGLEVRLHKTEIPGTGGMGTMALEHPARAHFIELQGKLLDYYRVTASSRYLELQNPPMKAHVLEAGQGQPLVILRGGDGEAVMWAPLMAPLQHHVHVYAADRPGFGLSDAFDYRRVDLRSHGASFVCSLLDALGLETAAVAGGSIGGFFATAAALAHPDRVRKLLLVGMPVGLTRSAPLSLRIICGVPRASRLFMKTRRSMKSQKKQYRDMFHTDPATGPELSFQTRLAGLALPVEKDTWAVLLHRVAGLGGFRSEVYLGGELPELQPPMLILWGEKDMAPAPWSHSTFVTWRALFVFNRMPKGFAAKRGALS